MTSRIFNQRIMFSGLAITVLGAGIVASADKAAKPAKSCPSCCLQKTQSSKSAAAKNTAIKTTAAKSNAGKPAAVKATPAKAASAKAPAAQSAGRSMKPVAGAGWIYRDPGSPLPQNTTTRGVVVPRIQAAKDPKDGISMTLPPLTASVATVDAKGHVDYDCEPGAGHSHPATKTHK